jgi:uncharacterized membrane-anchored protein YjiN (DUF445 family)
MIDAKRDRMARGTSEVGDATLARGAPPATRRRTHVGSVSLGVAVAGAVGTRAALHLLGPDAALQLLAAGFEAGVVGGLADWFAVTALFRHPLGLRIPHTAIIATRRAKIVDSIVTMVETDWLSPEVIARRLERITPSTFLRDWLGDRAHVARLAAPVRDVLRRLARLLDEPELAGFLERLVREPLRSLPADDVVAGALGAAVDNPAIGQALASAATSLANLAERPRTVETLTWWIERSAEKLHEEGRRLVPFVLRRRSVQRRLVDAACAYATAELRGAAADPEHPLRRWAKGALRGFAERLGAGDASAREQMAQLRRALAESLDVAPIVREALAWTRVRLETELGDAHGEIARFVERQLEHGIRDLLADDARRAAVDGWVRDTLLDLVSRHHDQIGLTVRENLEALETGALVQMIEERVGDDLQYIRLNGALVGGLIGLLLAAGRLALGG